MKYYVETLSRQISIVKKYLLQLYQEKRALDMETTAEGVETHDDLALVRSLGCSHVQGYIYGQPMELAEVQALLRAGGGRVEAKGYKSVRAPRLTVFRTIHVDSGGYRYEAIVRNIAPRGALVEGLWNVPPGTRLSLEFGPDQRIDAEARWSADNRTGVQFAAAVDIEELIGAKASPPRGRARRTCCSIVFAARTLTTPSRWPH